MSEPSVKGSMLLLSVLAVRRLKQATAPTDEAFRKALSPEALALLKRAGNLPADVFEKSLSDETLALLDREIVITSWYPMWQFNELEEFMWEHLSKRDPSMARKAGAESFKSMQKTGRYQQFAFAERAEGATSTKDVIRQTRLIASILAGYYNFLEVEVGLDPDSEDLQIVYGNAGLFCDPLRYSTEGFMTAVTRVRNGVTDWISERVAPDRIVFTLPHARSRR
jgi:hypothetical protein